MFTTAAAKDEVAELMDYLPLVDFPVSSGLTSRPPLANVANMAQAIFQGGALNLSAVKESSLSVDRLALIRNRTADTCFHRFPTAISERIVKMFEVSQDLADESDGREFVFLTRGESADSKRQIPAQQAMIEEAKSRGFRVMNPEVTTLPHLVRSISSCKGLICSWGGALTNAAFLKPDTRVGILKLPAYQDESLNVIFGHMIEEHALSTRVMKVDEQEDNLHEFQLLLDWVVGARGKNASSGES
jgi:capsular polysaccharide biosynthesis protein